MTCWMQQFGEDFNISHLLRQYSNKSNKLAVERQNLSAQDQAKVKAERPVDGFFLLLIYFVHLENQFDAIKGLGSTYFTVYTRFSMWISGAVWKNPGECSSKGLADPLVFKCTMVPSGPPAYARGRRQQHRILCQAAMYIYRSSRNKSVLK